MLSPDAIPMLLAGYVLIALIALALWPPCKGQPRVVWILAGASLVAVMRLSVPGHGFSAAGIVTALAYVMYGVTLTWACQTNKWLAGCVLGLLTLVVYQQAVDTRFAWEVLYEALAHVVCGVLLRLAFQKDKLAGWSLFVITIFEGIMFAMR